MVILRFVLVYLIKRFLEWLSAEFRTYQDQQAAFKKAKEQAEYDKSKLVNAQNDADRKRAIDDIIRDTFK